MKITQKELNKIAEEHKLWIDTKGDKGKRANLKNIDLSKLCLSNIDFSEARLWCVTFSEDQILQKSLGRFK